MYIFISPQPPDIAFGPAFEGPTTIALQQQAAHIGSNHRSLSRLLAIKGNGSCIGELQNFYSYTPGHRPSHFLNYFFLKPNMTLMLSAIAVPCPLWTSHKALDLSDIPWLELGG